MTLLRAWLILAVVALAIHLADYALIDSDEGRNAEVAREMAVTNDYVVPRYNGLPYLDKPVLYFAAVAMSIEVLGATELAARLPSYLFTLATAAVLFWFARRVWDERTAWIAAIIHLATPLTVAFSRIVIFDSALTFFSVLALACFYLAIAERQAKWSVLAWIALGFAMITKGPVGLLLVLPPALIFAWRSRALRLLVPAAGLLLFALIVAPWVWGMSQVVPEFLRYVLVTETVERMATDALNRTGPPWYFLPYVIGGALPWSIMLIFSWKRLRERDPVMLYWALAVLVPFVFFSISQSKRPQYVLPLMPPLALLLARIWDEARTRAAAVTLVVIGAILMIAPAFQERVRMDPDLLVVVDEVAIALGLTFLVAGLVPFFVARRELVLVALSVPALALPICAQPLLAAIAEQRSSREVVRELEPHLTPQTEVIGIEAFTGSLVFYLERPITLVTEDTSELTSNYLERNHEKFIGAPATRLAPLTHFVPSLAQTNPRVYLVRIQDSEPRRLLEARGWRVIADGADIVAYGR